MIVYSIQDSLQQSDRTKIVQLIDAFAQDLRLQVKHVAISELETRQSQTHIATLLSIGDALWQARFLGAVSETLRNNHDLVLAHITPRVQKIPIAQIQATVLKSQFKQELQTIAARKITRMPVFSCDNHLFLNQLELTTGQTASTTLAIDATNGNSRYHLRCPGSIVRLIPLQSSDSDPGTLLQLHILHEGSPKARHTQPIFRLVKEQMHVRQDQEDVLHIPIKKATIHTETSLLFENDPHQRTSRQFSIEILPWKLRVITAKNTPQDID
ncbi:hypothetical protein IT415_00580 [bacterium]|nr:hypothetical protein [bacterium]